MDIVKQNPFTAAGTAAGAVALVGELPQTKADFIALVVKALALPLIGLVADLVSTWIKSLRTRQALGAVGEMLDVIFRPIWDRLSGEVQLALADGRLTVEEEASLKVSVEAALLSLFSRDTIRLAMAALKVPDIGGLVSWLVTKLLARVKGAHDFTDPTVSNAVQAIYPLRAGPPPAALEAEASFVTEKTDVGEVPPG